MSLKRLFLRLLLWSVVSICQSNFFMSKYYHSTSSYCVTNTSFAMGWIKPIGRIKSLEWNIKTDARYMPESTKLTLSYPWIPKNSLNESFNHVILDDRWEEMPLLLTPNNYKNVIRILKSDFTVPLSISINNDAYIFLCEKLEPLYSDCYWFLLQSFNGTATAIQKCGSFCVPWEGGYYVRRHMYTSSKFRKDHKSEDEKYLFDTMWTHFEIGKKGNHFFLNQFKNGVSSKIIDWVDDATVINVNYLIVNSGWSQGLWKIHQVNYTYVDKECSTILGKFKKNKDNSVCVSMYIAMCANCKIKLTATGDNYSNEETYNYQKGWTQIKYIASNVGDGELTLTLSTIGNDENKFWAIDKVRTCHKEEYRKIETRGKHIYGELMFESRACQLMSKDDKNLISLQNDIGVSHSNCPVNAIGDFCMPCSLLYPTGCASLQVCTTEKCVCSAGYDTYDQCRRVCERGRYGHGCRKKCEKNCKICNNVHGICQLCHTGYKLPRCASVTKNPPEITTNSTIEIESKFSASSMAPPLSIDADYPDLVTPVKKIQEPSTNEEIQFETLKVLAEIRDELKKLTEAVLQVADAISTKSNDIVK